MNVTNLSALRLNAAHPLTVREMGARIGCTGAMVSLFENGKRMIGPALVERYAAAVGVPVHEVRIRFARDAVRHHREQLAAMQALVAALGRPGAAAGR